MGSDHIADLASLYLFGWLVGRDNIPSGPGRQFQTVDRHVSMMPVGVDSHVFNLTPAGVAVDNNVIELWEGPVHGNNGVTVTPFVTHDPVERAYGFRVEYKGNSAVVSGDTTFDQNLISHSQKVDLLAHDLPTRVRAARYSGPVTIGQNSITITVNGSNIVVTPPTGPTTNDIPARGVPAEVASSPRTASGIHSMRGL